MNNQYRKKVRTARLNEKLKLDMVLEKAAYKAILPYFDRAASAAAAAVRDGRKSVASNAIAKNLEPLNGVLFARLFDAAVQAGNVHARFLEQDIARKRRVQDQTWQRALRQWAREYAALKIAGIAERLAKWVSVIIARGVRDGLGNSSIAKQIEDKLGGDRAKSRAMRIARTETHAATEYASHQVNKQYTKDGIELEKEWCAVEDKRTRPDHAAVAGVTIDYDKLFIVGGVKMRFCGDPDAPPEQIINCRCKTLTYVKGIR